MATTTSSYLTFWSLEPPYPKGRLRYHLGQVYMLEWLERHMEEAGSATAIICDPPAILQARARTEVENHRSVIRTFLSAAPRRSLSVYFLSELVQSEKAFLKSEYSVRERAFIEAFHFLHSAIADLTLSQQARSDLVKYREPSGVGVLEPSLHLPFDRLRAETDLPSRLLLGALYAFTHRSSWFEANSIAATCASLAGQTGRSLSQQIVLEARRNAYAWITIEALFEIAKRTLPDAVVTPEFRFIENIPAIHGKSYMKLANEDGCVFIDTKVEELNQSIRETSTEVQMEWCRLIFGDQSVQQTTSPPIHRITELILQYQARLRHAGLLIAAAEPQPEEAESVDLILKGGGMKGIALVGAVSTLWPYFRFNRFFGTSAGAIIATLLGAGYHPQELKEILFETDFRDFLDRPRIRGVANLIFRGGLYSGVPFQRWFEEKLKVKIQLVGPVRMQHLPHRVVIFAAQRGTGTIRFDSQGENLDTSVTFAVRSSMSIPLFFVPTFREGQEVYDGGVLNNFPYRRYKEMFPHEPFVGVVLLAPPRQGARVPFPRALQFLSDLYNLWTGQDEVSIIDENRTNLVVIDPSPLRTTEFALGKPEKEFLLGVGSTAALRFLSGRGLVSTDHYRAALDTTEALRSELLQNRLHARKRRLRIFGGCIAILVLTLLLILVK